jgi:hypothetical protein
MFMELRYQLNFFSELRGETFKTNNKSVKEFNLTFL